MSFILKHITRAKNVLAYPHLDFSIMRRVQAENQKEEKMQQPSLPSESMS